MFRYVPLMLKNSLRNRRRSSLTIVSIAASLCLLAILVALYRGLFLAPLAAGQELRLVTHHKVSVEQMLPASYGDKIRQVPGVREAMVWQWFGGTYKDARDQRNFFSRFSVEPDRFFRVRAELQMPEDQKLAFQRQRTGAIASADLAKRMGWKTGERIFLVHGDLIPVNAELILVGIFTDANATETLYFSQAYLRELAGPNSYARDLVDSFEIQAESAEAATTAAKTIDEMFHNSTAPTKTETEAAFGLQFLAVLGNIKLYLMSICAAVTFTILLVSGNTMAMSVRERVREVGILKTLGYTSRAILFIILGEAGIIALLGGTIGVALASALLSVVRNSPVGLQQVQNLSITPDVGAACLTLALVIGVASSFVPALNAARMPILDSLRDTG